MGFTLGLVPPNTVQEALFRVIQMAPFHDMAHNLELSGFYHDMDEN